MQKIKSYILSRSVFAPRIKLLGAKKDFYEAYGNNNLAIVDHQLNSFNKVWKRALSDVAFYKWWAKEYHLPKQLNSLEELKSFPVLTKEIMQQKQSLIFVEGRRYKTVSTGGSSGQPTRFITTKNEKSIEYSNTYLGRSKFGIAPFDPTILFWGHSHLFGSGIKGNINELKRKFADNLLSIKRFNAYDLSVDTISYYVEKLINEKTKCLIGYTSSIYSLARYILDNKIKLDLSSSLKGVIVTSETISDRDIEIIGKAFKVPVISEYGMAETSVVAYSVPNERGLKIFWDSFIVQIDRSKQLNLTTIYDRKFPLINYSTDDVASPLKEVESSVLKIEKIEGRRRDNIKLRTKNKGFVEISGILLVHITKGSRGVYSISYKQCENYEVEIYVVTAPGVDVSQVFRRFLLDLKKENAEIDPLAIRMIKKVQPNRTLAGKNAMKVN